MIRVRAWTDLYAVIVIAPPGGQFENAVGAIAPKFLSHDRSTYLKRSTSVYAMIVIAPPKFMSLSLLNQPVSLSLPPSLPPPSTDLRRSTSVYVMLVIAPPKFMSLSLLNQPVSLSLPPSLPPSHPPSPPLTLSLSAPSLSQIDTFCLSISLSLGLSLPKKNKTSVVSGAGSIQGTHSKFLGTRNFFFLISSAKKFGVLLLPQFLSHNHETWKYPCGITSNRVLCLL